MPAASWSGLSATTICIVEQFGLAMMPSVAVERLRVDLGDDERDLGVACRHARGVVDDDGARARELRRPLAGRRAAGGEEREVEALDRRRRAARWTTRPSQLAAGRALGGERHDLARPGSARSRSMSSIAVPTAPVAPTTATAMASVRVLIARPSPERLLGPAIVVVAPSSKAECSARTASATRSPRIDAGDLDRRGRDHLDVDALRRRASRRPWRRRRGATSCRRRRSRPCPSPASVATSAMPSSADDRLERRARGAQVRRAAR